MCVCVCVCVCVVQGVDFLAAVSPLLVVLLLCKVSGIPLLERAALSGAEGTPPSSRHTSRPPQTLPLLSTSSSCCYELHTTLKLCVCVCVFATAEQCVFVLFMC